MPGPKRKPTHLRKLQGTARADRMPENEPEPDLLEDVPPAPEWMTGTGEAIWNEYAPKLVKLGLLTEIDVPAFEAMCTHYGLMVSAAKELQKGVTKEGYRGDEKKHPAAQVFRDNSKAFRAYAAMFGMSPADRAKVSAAIAKEDEPKGILGLAS